MSSTLTIYVFSYMYISIVILKIYSIILSW